MARCAAVVGLIALLGSTALSGCGGIKHSLAPPAEAASSTTSAPEQEQPPTPAIVTLAFAGDLHFQLHLAALLEHPRGALGPIARTLADADLAMVNLESAITQSGIRDPKELEDAYDRYWYRTSPAALDLLAAAGVDVVTMANNHGADYGLTGLRDTLRAVRHSEIPVIGIGRDRRAAFTPYVVSVRGTDVAFLAADTTFREGSSSVWSAGPRTPGIADARGPHREHLLQAVRDAGRRADVVVVYLHWGIETESCPSREQRVRARELAEAGAAVVVGSHAHVQVGSGWLGETYVSYGLGNFVWYHNREPETGVLTLRIEDGAVVHNEWTPARIGLWGLPRPLRGAARRAAVSDWRGLRGCAGLQGSPTTLLPRLDERAPEKTVEEGP